MENLLVFHGLCLRPNPSCLKLSTLMGMGVADYLSWVEVQLTNPLLESDLSLSEISCSEPVQDWHDRYEEVERQVLGWEAEEQKIALYLLAQLDGAGYFRGSPVQIAAERGCDLNVASRVLNRFKEELEPAGIGASSLIECLTIQMKRDEKLRGRAAEIRLCLEGLEEARGEFRATLLKKLEEIKHLNPKPLEGGFSSIYRFQYDFLYKEGRVVLPYTPLLVMTCAGGCQEEVKRAREAVWMSRKRKNVLQKIGELVCKRQRGFLEGGEALQHLTIREVAQEVGLHESTVSRAVSHKVVEAPTGRTCLRSLFSQKILPLRGQG